MGTITQPQKRNQMTKPPGGNMTQIINRFNNNIIAENKNKSIKELTVKNKANLRQADLRGADLRGADLRGADLQGAKIRFYLFPSIRLLSSIFLRDLPDNLTLELMRRDAYAHPKPELFDKWAKTTDDNNECPYRNEETFWQFKPKKELWRKGEPQMADRDLIIEICKSQGWKIRGYLE